MKILGISGSLKAGSANRTLLEIAARRTPADVLVEVYDGLRELPHFDPDLENDAPVALVQTLRAAVRSADALLLSCPEYGHSLPGSLKNAIDWLIGTGELEGKIVGVTAVVPHPERGRRGLRALEDTLAAVSAVVVGGEPIVKGPNLESDVERLVGEIAETVRVRRAATV